jgi:hypothetical protein
MIREVNSMEKVVTHITGVSGTLLEVLQYWNQSKKEYGKVYIVEFHEGVEGDLRAWLDEEVWKVEEREQVYGKNEDMSPKEVVELAGEMELDDFYGGSPESLRGDCLNGITMEEAIADVEEGEERFRKLMSKYVGRELEDVKDARSIDFDEEGLDDPTDISQRHKDLW